MVIVTVLDVKKKRSFHKISGGKKYFQLKQSDVEQKTADAAWQAGQRPCKSCWEHAECQQFEQLCEDNAVYLYRQKDRGVAPIKSLPKQPPPAPATSASKKGEYCASFSQWSECM